jgi:hypothetical protein
MKPEAEPLLCAKASAAIYGTKADSNWSKCCQTVMAGLGFGRFVPFDLPVPNFGSACGEYSKTFPERRARSPLSKQFGKRSPVSPEKFWNFAAKPRKGKYNCSDS